MNINKHSVIPATRYHNMVECLRSHAQQSPDVEALVVVDASGERHFTFGQLDQASRALAVQLQQRYAPGDRALLLLDNNEDYVVAFFACLYAGLIAVPAFPPASARPQHLSRLQAIADDAKAVCLLASSVLREVLAQSTDCFGEVEELYVDEIDLNLANQWQEHQPQSSDVAFLQYTSGSTSTPKGVMVSHGNLVANEQFIEDAYSMTDDDIIVSWLPLFHDMGLIGGMLQPVYRGIKLILMSPTFFLERPCRWLDAISKFKGTVSGGPDFAFRLCLQRVKTKDIEQLDLSSWRIAFSGSEPIRVETLDLFTQYFQAVGFSASALYPCYGLAEATLILSGGVAGSGVTANNFDAAALQRSQVVATEVNGQRLVGCGNVQAGHQLALFDPAKKQPVAADTIGEIWATGPSITLGYWGNEKATAETFVEYDNQRWLRTGDLGFFYQEQIYISGRLKDVIILNGSNYYPQDIEQLIEKEVDISRPGRVSAFPVGGLAGEYSEGLGIAMELSRKHLKSEPIVDVVEQLNQVLAPVCRQQVAMVIVLNPGALPKTSSGKLQRSACFKLWQQGSLDLYATWYYGEVSGPGAAAQTALAERQVQKVEVIEDELEQQLADIWAEVLGIATSALGRNSSFLRLGGNSQAATQIASRINGQFGVTFPAFVLFESPQLKAVADSLKQKLAANPEAEDYQAIKPLADEWQGQQQPLSAAQQRQWFLWRMEPNSCANQVIGSLSLKGKVDATLLAQCLNLLVERHESLRAVFELDAQGQPVQSVEPSLNLSLLQEKSPQIEPVVQQWFEQPFDLSHGPLLRAGLIERTDDEFVLVLVMHHIITDGWSMTVLVKELFALYAAKSAGVEVNLEPLPLRYSDYTHWQQQWLNSPAQQQQLAFWQDVLGSEHEVLQLPSDKPRQAIAQYDEAQYHLQLPTSLIAAIQGISRANNSTVFITMMTALQVLLYRYSGQADIRVGVPVHNRQDTQLEGIVGLFVNTLVFRSQIGDGLTVSELMQQVRRQALDGQQHQQLPFEQLVESLQIERSLSHTPVFQVMYNHRQQRHLQLDSLPELAIEQLDLAIKKRAQFELALDVVEFDNGDLSIRFDYAEQLFSQKTIAQFANHFERMLTLITQVDSQQIAVSQLPLIAQSQLQTLMAWGAKPLPHTDELVTVQQGFERIAEQAPQSVAVVFEQQQITYGELNQKANQLANILLNQGLKAGNESKIGIALERSIDMIVAVLATLKTGAAYVPLDPNYPQERIAYMIEDSQLNLVITRNQWLSQFAAVNCVALEQLALGESSMANPDVQIHPQQLAYIIYTSGSTGNPKGVAVSHRALSQHLHSAQEYIGVTASDRVLMFATLNFDSCLEQMFCPLVVGASVILRGDELWDSNTFHQQLLEQQITVVDFTTAYWDTLLTDFARRNVTDFGQLRQVNVGGEAMSTQSIDLWRRHSWGDARLVNVYGPTEAVVTATCFDCRVSTSSDAVVPIGAPLAGRQLYVLDGNMMPVPVGVPGELYIGGELLARGYLQRSGLTAERFVADPFSEQGGRLYRTGDRVRWHHDGQLEYVGRTDSQLKIRGFRVEIDEIETVLRRLPQVAEAVVIAQHNSRLLAYVVPVDAKQQDGLESVLRSSLLQRMPEYMVPAVIITLNAIPMTPSGKLDRKALPKPQVAKPELVSPKSETEQQLADIWRQLLGLEQVGRDSNFFEAGGHSLMALKLQNRIDELFEINISVMDIFQYSTVRKQAEFIDQQLAGGSNARQNSQNIRENRQQRAQKARAGVLSRASKRKIKGKKQGISS